MRDSLIRTIQRVSAAAALSVALATGSVFAAEPGALIDTHFSFFDVGGNLTDEAFAVTHDAFGTVVVGRVATGTGTWDAAVLRFLPDGSPDPAFGTNGRVVSPFTVLHLKSLQIRAIASGGGGAVYLAGSVEDTGSESTVDFFVGCLDRYGDPCTVLGAGGYQRIAFDLPGGGTDEAWAVAYDGQGKIVVAGTADSATGHDFAVARLWWDGELDSGFSGDGKATVDFTSGTARDDYARAMALTKWGDVVVAGYTRLGNSGADYDIAMTRLTASGDLDLFFGAGNTGKALFALDLGGDYGDKAYAMAIQPDGKIVLAGQAAVASASWKFIVLRTDSLGSALDPDFAYGAGYNLGNFACPGDPSCDYRDAAYGVVLQGDGRIVVTGVGRAYPPPAEASNTDVGVARLFSNGLFDWTFGPAAMGVNLIDLDYGNGFDRDAGNAVTLDGSGRIVVVGSAEFSGFDWDFVWLRFDSDYVFADGFEPGSFGGWSSHVP